jgi:prepilin-type N-terminal cleavage/methylation domain-containing protein
MVTTTTASCSSLPTTSFAPSSGAADFSAQITATDERFLTSRACQHLPAAKGSGSVICNNLEYFPANRTSCTNWLTLLLSEIHHGQLQPGAPFRRSKNLLHSSSGNCNSDIANPANYLEGANLTYFAYTVSQLRQLHRGLGFQREQAKLRSTPVHPMTRTSRVSIHSLTSGFSLLEMAIVLAIVGLSYSRA